MLRRISQAVLAGSLMIAVLTAFPDSAAVERRTSGVRTDVSEPRAQKRSAAGATVHRITASASDVSLPWYSFPGGGLTTGASATNELGGSIGQSMAGSGSTADYWLGIGFWSGANACSCPHQADYDGDGFHSPLDLGGIIDIMFLNDPDIQDPNCPTSRFDFDCNGDLDPIDLGSIIDFLFANGPPPCSPCAEL
jgi:hypothetical protein